MKKLQLKIYFQIMITNFKKYIYQLIMKKLQMNLPKTKVLIKIIQRITMKIKARSRKVFMQNIQIYKRRYRKMNLTLKEQKAISYIIKNKNRKNNIIFVKNCAAAYVYGLKIKRMSRINLRKR